jgi:amino acid transporter
MNAPAAELAPAPSVRRSLGRFDLVCIGLNAIVGSGVFALPDDMYREMGALSPLAFLLCALGLLPVALCYAEAGSRVDRNGGPYVYASQAFGRHVGYGVGWMSFVNSIFSFAAVAAIAAANLGELIPALASPARIVAALIVVAFAALNYYGAKPGARAVDLFTIGKFAVLLLLVAVLLPQMSFERVESAPASFGYDSVKTAIFLALFAAQGFEVVPITAGETHSPQRHVPIAVVGSLLAASALYVVVQTVLIGSYPGLGAVSDTPLVDAARAYSAPLGQIVVIGALISTLGFVSGSALGTPRYLHAAAADGHLHGRLASVHARFASPHWAIGVTALFTVAVVLILDYRDLIGISNVAVAVQYLSTSLAVPVLRREGRAPLHLAGGWLLPIAGGLVSLWIFTAASWVELVWAAASLSVGILLTAVSGRRGAPQPD